MGESPNPMKRLNFRKLHSEAFTRKAAYVKRKVLQPENEEKHRQLDPPKRKSRMDLFQRSSQVAR